MPGPAPSPIRLAAAALAAALLLAGSAASGATRPAEEAAVAQASAAETWKGRFCTMGSCRNATASPLGAAASFGAAILAIGWLSRRATPRSAPPGSSAPGSE
jgi:hypothetical protein